MDVNALNPNTTTAPTSRKKSLQAEDFVNLMVTQLQHQDPSKPTDNSELLAQMSQIGQLQSSQDLQSSLKTLVLQSNLGSAGNLIGKHVEGIDGLGDDTSGTVSSVKVVEGNITLELDSGASLRMDKITSITTPSTDTVGAK